MIFGVVTVYFITTNSKEALENIVDVFSLISLISVVFIFMLPVPYDRELGGLILREQYDQYLRRYGSCG